MFRLNEIVTKVDIYVKFNPIHALTIEPSQITQATPNKENVYAATPHEQNVHAATPHNQNVHVETFIVDENLHAGENLNAENVHVDYNVYIDDDVSMSDTEGEESEGEEGSMTDVEGDVTVSSSDCEWDEENESKNSGSDEEAVGVEGEEERLEDGGLSDFEELINEMGLGVNADSDVEEVYIDRGMSGKPFVREPSGKIRLEAGLLFNDMNHFRQVLRDYVIQEGFEIVRVKNEKARVTAMCATHGCTWHIHASPTPDKITYKIKTYTSQHTCIRATRNSNATSTWIAQKLQQKLYADPNMSYASMKEELRQEYGVKVHPMQLYRAKRKANEDNKDSHAKSYSMLPITKTVTAQATATLSMEFESEWASL